MSIIAKETEAATIGGSSGAIANKMCTKAIALALGCKVSGTYSDNQLVQLDHLVEATLNKFSCYWYLYTPAQTEEDHDVNSVHVQSTYAVTTKLTVTLSYVNSNTHTVENPNIIFNIGEIDVETYIFDYDMLTGDIPAIINIIPTADGTYKYNY